MLVWFLRLCDQKIGSGAVLHDLSTSLKSSFVWCWAELRVAEILGDVLVQTDLRPQAWDLMQNMVDQSSRPTISSNLHATKITNSKFMSKRLC